MLGPRPFDIIAGALQPLLPPYAAENRATAIIAALDLAAAAEEAATGLQPGDIVQVVENSAYGGWLMVVTDTTDTEVFGFMPLGVLKRAPIRLALHEVVQTGGRVATPFAFEMEKAS